MPELPEVETTRRGLAPLIRGRRVSQVRLLRKNLRFPLPKDFVGAMRGAKIEKLTRHGKYLLAHMQGAKKFIWLSHLGMSGRYIFCPPQSKTQPREKHIHMTLRLSDGGVLHYADPRRFGFFEFFEGTPERSRFLAHLGPDALSAKFDAGHLWEKCASRRTAIKNLLLDQRVVAGLGNIYVSEALFTAKISPSRPAAKLGFSRAARLVAATRDTLRAAIAAGGSTLRDFAASDGRLGYFQHAFKVYGRTEKTCLRDKCSGKIERLVQAGRASFYCPNCQK